MCLVACQPAWQPAFRCLPAYVFGCLLVNRSVWLPACLNVSVPTCLSMCLPACHSMRLPACLSASVCVGLPSACQPLFLVAMPACLPSWLCVWLPACLVVCMPAYVFGSLYLPMCLATCLHTSQPAFLFFMNVYIPNYLCSVGLPACLGTCLASLFDDGDVSCLPLSGISGLSFDSPFISPLLFFLLSPLALSAWSFSC